jgi:hypothetical protein
MAYIVGGWVTYGTVFGTVVDPVETLVQSHKGDQGEDERDDSEECRKPLYKDAKQASILSASCSCRDEMTIATPILIDRTHGQDEPREPAPLPKDGEQQSEEGQAGQSGRDGGDDQGTGETVGVTGNQGIVVLQSEWRKGKRTHKAGRGKSTGQDDMANETIKSRLTPTFWIQRIDPRLTQYPKVPNRSASPPRRPM